MVFGHCINFTPGFYSGILLQELRNFVNYSPGTGLKIYSKNFYLIIKLVLYDDPRNSPKATFRQVRIVTLSDQSDF